MTDRDGRPDPDPLLERVREEQGARTPCRFKLFFGAAARPRLLQTEPGVGYRLRDDVEIEGTDAG